MGFIEDYCLCLKGNWNLEMFHQPLGFSNEWDKLDLPPGPQDSSGKKKVGFHTVDGRNLAPPAVYKTL